MKFLEMIPPTPIPLPQIPIVPRPKIGFSIDSIVGDECVNNNNNNNNNNNSNKNINSNDNKILNTNIIKNEFRYANDYQSEIARAVRLTTDQSLLNDKNFHLQSPNQLHNTNNLFDYSNNIIHNNRESSLSPPTSNPPPPSSSSSSSTLLLPYATNLPTVIDHNLSIRNTSRSPTPIDTDSNISNNNSNCNNSNNNNINNNTSDTINGCNNVILDINNKFSLHNNTPPIRPLPLVPQNISQETKTLPPPPPPPPYLNLPPPIPGPPSAVQSPHNNPHHNMLQAQFQMAAIFAQRQAAAAEQSFPSIAAKFGHHPPPHLLNPTMTRDGGYPLYPWLLSRHGRILPHGFPGSFLLHPFRKPKRVRTAFSPSQLLKLEHAFENNQYVVGAERKALAQALNLSETQVKVWFQNRRTKHKRQQQEDESKGSGNGGSGIGGNGGHSGNNSNNNNNDSSNHSYDDDDEMIDMEMDDECMSDDELDSSH